MSSGAWNQVNPGRSHTGASLFFFYQTKSDGAGTTLQMVHHDVRRPWTVSRRDSGPQHKYSHLLAPSLRSLQGTNAQVAAAVSVRDEASGARAQAARACSACPLLGEGNTSERASERGIVIRAGRQASVVVVAMGSAASSCCGYSRRRLASGPVGRESAEPAPRVEGYLGGLGPFRSTSKRFLTKMPAMLS